MLQRMRTFFCPEDVGHLQVTALPLTDAGHSFHLANLTILAITYVIFKNLFMYSVHHTTSTTSASNIQTPHRKAVRFKPITCLLWGDGSNPYTDVPLWSTAMDLKWKSKLMLTPFSNGFDSNTPNTFDFPHFCLYLIIPIHTLAGADSNKKWRLLS